MSVTVVTSAASDYRNARGRDWLKARLAVEEVLIIGATLSAANELARSLAQEKRASFGYHRMTLGQLAAGLARGWGALPLFWRAARGMEHSKDLDFRATDPVGNEIACIENDQFTGAGNSPGPSQVRLRGKLRHCIQDALDDQTGSGCIVSRNVGCFLVKVAQRCTQPTNPHSLSTCSRDSQRRFRLQSPQR